MLRQQRAALNTSSASTANERSESPANVSQSDVSQLLNQYREAELQVGFSKKNFCCLLTLNQIKFTCS